MSLQSFIESKLKPDVRNCNFLTSIAVVGHDGNVLAQTSNFPKMKPNDVTAIMTEFDNPGSLALTGIGLHIGEDSYVVVRGEPGAVIRGTGKYKAWDTNVTIKKTTCGFIIGMYGTMTPGNMIVEEMGEYVIQHEEDFLSPNSTMSLQSFIESKLMKFDVRDGNFLTSVAVVGYDGNVLAQTVNFPKIKPNDVTAIMTKFDNPGSLALTGFHIGEDSYVLFRGRPGVVRGTSKNVRCKVSIRKTTRGLIIGIYHMTTMGNMIVEEMGEYIIQHGF